MTTVKRQRFVAGVTAWMLTATTVLTALGSLEAELFFVLSLIGFLVVVELTAPLNVTPQWRRRLQIIVVIGVIIFGMIVTRRIISILQDQGELPADLFEFSLTLIQGGL